MISTEGFLKLLNKQAENAAAAADRLDNGNYGRPQNNPHSQPLLKHTDLLLKVVDKDQTISEDKALTDEASHKTNLASFAYSIFGKQDYTKFVWMRESTFGDRKSKHPRK
ncbi:hypothetical protein MBANPS3_012374 [Mucor bainieri]